MTRSTEDQILEGVAVIGLAGRFPGAGSVAELWENLKAGRESITVFSDGELAAEGIPDHLIHDPSYVKARGLLRRPEDFDAAFFGITPHEAELMDPQHRLFLESCWHGLENAGYAPSGIPGRVGVWGGMSTGMANDTYLHENLGGPAGVREEDVLTALLGNEGDYLTTRVSYKLDLRGPSVTVQTACSTSLVAVAQAFESLMTFGCDMAVAGGVSVSYPQRAGYLHQEGGIGSPDGHCRPFDAEAQGTVFSNGVGVAVLKRLEDAMADGDTVLAVVRGAATNNDGASKVSFAAPSVDGQADVIAMAQAVAGVDPGSITFVETHGTGTPLGDPIEVQGLSKAFRRGTEESKFCALGSIKSNFGHLDSAAGIAGFIKTVLCLRHRTLVPTVHFRTPSPKIDWSDSPFYVNAETRSWDTDRLPRRAGVSAFGIGGTNAHVILEEPPEAPRRGGSAAGIPQLLPLSARSPEALQRSMEQLTEHLREESDLRLADVAHTLQVGRAAFRHRAAAVVSEGAQIPEAFGIPDRARVALGEADTQAQGLVFLLPGGGAQYVGMGRGLCDAFPRFRQDVERGLELMARNHGLDLRPIWFPADDETDAVWGAFQRPSVQLPAIFIIEMAMAGLLRSWGFEPSAFIGHSMGENTAACLAGVLTYEDALGLVALRGRLFDDAAAGGMISVAASPGALEAHLAPELDLAAVNGPEQCTVSGPRGALDDLRHRLEAEGFDVQVVPIDIAAHSPLVEPLMEPFEAYLRRVELSPPQIPFLSNLTGTWITDAEATDPAYWASQLRHTVRFGDNVRTVLEKGRTRFLEVGPGRILSSLVKLADPGLAPLVAPTMRHPREIITDEEALLGAVARIWVAGGDVAWERIRGDDPVVRVPLPGYPFERRPFLIEPERRAPTLAVGRAVGRGGGATETASASAESGDGHALQRLLDLQAQTNAAIRHFLAAQDHPTGPPPPAVQEDRPEPEPAPERLPLPERTAFWREQLEAPLPILDLIPDSPRTPEGMRDRSSVDVPIPPSLLSSVQQIWKDGKGGAFAALLAAYVATLHLETGQEELLVGVSAWSRDLAGAGGDADEASTSLPLRIRMDPGTSFRELVSEVRRHLEATWAHRGVPPDALEGLENDERSRIVRTRFAWGDRDVDEGSPPPDHGQDPTDVDVRVEYDHEGSRVTGYYAAGPYTPDTIRDLLGHFVSVLQAAVENPETSLRTLPRGGPGVMDRLDAWSRKDEPFPSVSTLASWLSADWKSNGSRVAVVAGKERVTYQELDERANRLAQHLVASGIQPGDLVGLCLERTADMIVSAVAVWKAGAGYVPLDPGYPAARLNLMANRADLAGLITMATLEDRLGMAVRTRVLLDRDRSAVEAREAHPPDVVGGLSDPAYVIFTSGSTGEPKGVRVPGRSVVNLIETMARRPGFAFSDVLLAVTTLSFDISVLELFLPLRRGGTVVLASSAEAMDGAAIGRLLEEHDVTVLQSTPSTWRLLLSAGWQGRPGLRALCGGEPFPTDLLEELLPRVGEVWNMYGPTESTVWSTAARLVDPGAPIVIGTPVGNTQCHVLDEGGRRVGPGVPGELHIGGMGVADGYVGRPEETARRFIPDPFSPGGGRLYRTGDMVRWRRDGTLEHLHRVDEQVKLRGFRIEPGEVEAALAAAPGIQAAAVVVREIDGSPELVGYGVAAPDEWTERALRESLSETLPAYMVPRFLVRLDELPLTANRKVDRKALPDPRERMAAESPGSGLVPPETEAEVYLHGLWQEILEMESVSLHDNFFDLGGHSLLAVRMLTRIRKERGVEIPLTALITGTLGMVAAEYLTGDRREGAGESGAEPGAMTRVMGTVREWMSR